MLNQFTASLWGDEAFSAILSMKSIPDIIRIIIKDTSPPLYNLTEHAWFMLFGNGEVAIRMLSFLYYLLAIFFVYKIGELLWSKKTGIISAILTFLNPFFFIYAFEGRMYSILALGVAASMYFYLKIILNKKPSRWDKIGYVAATAWALYSHHFSAFAVIIQGIWFLKELISGNKKTAQLLLKLFVFVGLAYSLWLYPLYKQITMVKAGFWLGTPTLKDLRNLIYEYLAEGIKNPQIMIAFLNRNLGQLALYVVFAGLLLRNWLKDTKKTIFLLLWFLGPILLAWLVSQKFTSIFYNRYLLYTIPASMLILASNRKKNSLLVIGVIIILFSIIDVNYFFHPTKRPFRDLAAYVTESKRGDDLLINWNSSAHHLWETKYYNIPAPIYIPGGGNLPYFVGTALMEKDDIISSLPVKIGKTKVNRIGVVTSGKVEEVILPGYTLLETKTFGSDLKFLWLKRIF